MVSFANVSIPGKGKLYARFETSMGDMVAELYEDLVPNTVKNFVGLATGQLEFTDPLTNEPRHPWIHDPRRMPSRYGDWRPRI